VTIELPGAESIISFDYRYVEQFLIAILMTSLTVLAHYVAMDWIRKYFRQFQATISSHRSRRLVMVGIVGIMMAAHFLEVWLWAIFYFLRGVVPTMMAAVYFSIACYSSLGESGIHLPVHWQGLGGFETMNAVLMFGWSTAMLAAIVMKMHNQDE
jgi:voltage-gated potassium channel